MSQHLMCVFVLVALSEMEPGTKRHQECTKNKYDIRRLMKQEDRYGSADERSKGEISTGACGSQMAKRRYISLYFTQLKDTKPLLRGRDLIEMGIKPGPAIRKTLDDLLRARLDEQVITRQDEMEYITKAYAME